MNLVRLVIHIEKSEIDILTPMYAKQIPHDPNRELRIQYMIGTISEDEFRSILQRREKDRLKREDYSQILTMFLEVCDDYLKQLLTKDLDFDQFSSRVETIRLYTNTSLGTVAEQYHTKTKYINKDLSEITSLDKVVEVVK